MPSCDVLKVTDGTGVSLAGEEGLQHDRKHLHVSSQVTEITVGTSLTALSSRAGLTGDPRITEVLPK